MLRSALLVWQQAITREIAVANSVQTNRPAQQARLASGFNASHGLDLASSNPAASFGVAVLQMFVVDRTAIGSGVSDQRGTEAAVCTLRSRSLSAPPRPIIASVVNADVMWGSGVIRSGYGTVPERVRSEWDPYLFAWRFGHELISNVVPPQSKQAKTG